jgi:hypothetical protein
VITRLLPRHPGGHDGINGKNEVPLVFEGKRLPARGLIVFSDDSSSYHVYRNGEILKLKKMSKMNPFLLLINIYSNNELQCNDSTTKSLHCNASLVGNIFGREAMPPERT